MQFRYELESPAVVNYNDPRLFISNIHYIVFTFIHQYNYNWFVYLKYLFANEFTSIEKQNNLHPTNKLRIQQSCREAEQKFKIPKMVILILY